VGIGERTAALQHREEAAVHLMERGLEGLAVRPPRASQRFPREPVDFRRLPRTLEGVGIGAASNPSSAPANRYRRPDVSTRTKATPDWHAGNRALSTTVWKTPWKSCGWV